MTKARRILISTIAGGAALAVASSAAFAQAGMMRQGQGMSPGMMGPGMQPMPGTPGQGMGSPQTPCPPGQGMGSGMMGPQMQQTPGMPGQGMGPGMIGQGMQQMPGMPGQGMGPGMMGPGGMQAMMAPGMGGQGMMGGQGPGTRVTPSQHLTTDDVSHFLGHFLERHGNPRLKIGEVREADEDTILAEIVTVDDSLVQRWRVDRHSGEMVQDATDPAQPAN